MRLWSLHPCYLDPAGLVAVWREGLLAQAVLRGMTRGYRHHPQLLRFREQADPGAAIAAYLTGIADEAGRRGYRFDPSRIERHRSAALIDVTEGQLLFEWRHLRSKLRSRNRGAYRLLAGVATPLPHPLFVIVPGAIERWERGTTKVRQTTSGTN